MLFPRLESQQRFPLICVYSCVSIFLTAPFIPPAQSAEILLAVDWESEPPYAWDHDSVWGDQHSTWDRPSNGAVGYCMRASHLSGDSKDNRGFTLHGLDTRLGHRIRIRISMACPTGTGKEYWMETSYKTFTTAPSDYGSSYDEGGWNMVQWFDAASWPENPDGNDSTWTEYSTTFVPGSEEDILAVGFESGSTEGTGGAPNMRWDSLVIEDLDGAVISTFTPTRTSPPTLTWTPTPSQTPTQTNTSGGITKTPTRTATQTETPKVSYTSTSSPTITLTPTITLSPTITITPTITDTPTLTETINETWNCVESAESLQISLWGESGYAPDIAVDRFGSAHIVWRSGTHQIMYARVGPNYLLEKSPMAIVTADARDPKVAVDYDGNAHVITLPFAVDSQSFLTYLKIDRLGTTLVRNSFVCDEFWPGSTDAITSARYHGPAISIWHRPPNFPLIAVAAEVHQAASRPIDPSNPYSPKKTFYRDGISVVLLNSAGEVEKEKIWEPIMITTENMPTADYYKYVDITFDTRGIYHCAWWKKDPGYSSGDAWDAWGEINNTGMLLLSGYWASLRHAPTVGPKVTANDRSFVDFVWADNPARSIIHSRLRFDSPSYTYVQDKKETLYTSTETHPENPNIASVSGTVVAIWSEDILGSHLWAQRLTPPGPAQQISCGKASSCAIDARANGYFDIVWQDSRSGTPVIYYASKDFSDPSPTPTHSPTSTGTNTRTKTPTLSSTRTPSPTATVTRTLTQTKAKSPTPTTTFDVAISSLELVQVVQNQLLTVPFVSGKPAMLRAYISVTSSGVAYNGEITGRLYYTPNGGVRTGPFFPSLNPGGLSATPNPDRGKLENSLNFRLPSAAIQTGITTLDVEINYPSPSMGIRPIEEANYTNNTQSKAYTFQSLTPHYRIGYYAVDYTFNSPLPPSGRPGILIHQGDHLFRKLFPLTSGNYVYVYEGEIKWNKDINISAMEFLTHLRTRWQLAENASAPASIHNNQLMAWFPEMAYAGNGCSDPTWLTNPGGIGHVFFANATAGTGQESCRFMRTFAHEASHNHNRYHPSDDASHPLETLAENKHYGFDVEKGEIRYKFTTPSGISLYYDIMVPARLDYETWITPYTYINLFNTFPIFTKSLNLEKQITSTALMVSGLINQNNTGVLHPAYQVNYATTPRGTNGNCSLTIEDNTGKALYTSLFSPVYVYPDSLVQAGRFIQDSTGGGLSSPAAGFIEILPVINGLKSIVLRQGSVELDRLTVSASAPTVTVLQPNGGEVWSETEEIRWTATDTDAGDAANLSYSILYSADGKQTWRTLETMYSQTSLQVHTTNLPGGTQCYVRVMVTDGINTGQDDSNASFTTVGNPPIALILSPRDGATFASYELIHLAGRVVDLEEKVNKEDILWESSLNGIIGTGYEVDTMALRPGTHTILCSLTDQDGYNAHDTITLTVNEGLILLGDLQRDGRIDYLDLLKLARKWHRSSTNAIDADLDGNGAVDSNDLMLLRRLMR